MSDPKENIGKICKSLEKYFDTRTGRMKVKSRPVLVIGCEEEYDLPQSIDYELLPISRINNFEPNVTYDFYLDEEKISGLGLNSLSYIRTHKTTWNHCKHMKVESPIGDLKKTYPTLFEEIMIKNHEWVINRTNNNITKSIDVVIKEESFMDDLPF